MEHNRATQPLERIQNPTGIILFSSVSNVSPTLDPLGWTEIYFQTFLSCH